MKDIPEDVHQIRQCPMTFKQLVQHCLNGQVIEFLLVYLDDIIVYFLDFFTHIVRLEQLFACMHQYGLKYNAD